MRSQNLVNLVLVLALAFSRVDCNREVDALSAWKSQLEDPNKVLDSWDSSLVNPCTWLHIYCNHDSSVTRVSLAYCNLSGPIVSQLADLTDLQYLEVYNNEISGSIPSEIGTLKMLITLDLSNNNLSGSIPPSLGNLTSLQILRLNSNKLTGIVPVQIKQLQESGILRIMDVTDNFLAVDTTSTVVSNEHNGHAIFLTTNTAQLILACFCILYFFLKDS